MPPGGFFAGLANYASTANAQVNLKNYDTQKDKRFSGSVKLPRVARPRPRAGPFLLGERDCCIGALCMRCTMLRKMVLHFVVAMKPNPASASRSASSLMLRTQTPPPSWGCP